jgi:hypothetical protein
MDFLLNIQKIMAQVTAAPNSTTIRFRVLDTRPDSVAAGKTILQMEILPAEAHHDQRFIKPGMVMPGFTFDKVPSKAGDIFIGEAEYLGGPRGGYVQVRNILKQ